MTRQVRKLPDKRAPFRNHEFEYLRFAKIELEYEEILFLKA
jgi:hypothetical protein